MTNHVQLPEQLAELGYAPEHWQLVDQIASAKVEADDLLTNGDEHMRIVLLHLDAAHSAVPRR